MRKLLLALIPALALGLLAPSAASAQTTNQLGCYGSGGVNSVPQIGVSCPLPSNSNTYSASSVSIVPAASATDLVCLAGASGVIIRVQKITVSGSAGTAIGLPISITKNAVADTAGTQATGTALPVAYKLDSTDAAAVGTFQANTTNPTVNDTSPGIIATAQVNLPTTAAGSGSAVAAFNWYNTLYSEQPTLRGAAQQICVNLNGISVTSGKVNIDWLWTETIQ